jgi:CubicO group peptidase (beta-lactamase class C family)
MYTMHRENDTLRPGLLERVVRCAFSRSEGRRNSFFLATRAILILLVLIPSGLVGCGPRTEDLEAVDYTPLPGEDWEVSTPAEQGLDPMLVAELYHNAAELETLYGLLVIKNGYLIAEGYFNEGSIEQLSGRQSATKSYTSALVGVALDRGCLSSVDQKMMDFFPEFADQITDPRKEQITIRDLLQMRGGYPDEERTPPYFEVMFFSGNYHWVPHLVDFPLTSDPGTKFQYSNLTSHLLGAIVSRACDTDLKSFAQEHLFSPMGAEVGHWTADADGYNFGMSEIYVTARDMAKFGSLYLNGGEYEGQQVLSAAWVADSLQRYSTNIKVGEWLTSRYGSFRDLGYGYQWWSGRAGKHRFDYASGHGGNYIILLDELDMIIVTTADPLHDLWDGNPWEYEGAINNLVGTFIKSLPKE